MTFKMYIKLLESIVLIGRNKIIRIEHEFESLSIHKLKDNIIGGPNIIYYTSTKRECGDHIRSSVFSMPEARMEVGS